MFYSSKDEQTFFEHPKMTDELEQLNVATLGKLNKRDQLLGLYREVSME